MTLYDLKTNQKAVITRINLTDIEKRRVMDLGIIRGEILTTAFDGPFGEPKAIQILDTLISLRAEERKKIEVELVV